MTALCIAAERDDPDAIKFLLSRGAKSEFFFVLYFILIFILSINKFQNLIWFMCVMNITLI